MYLSYFLLNLFLRFFIILIYFTLLVIGDDFYYVLRRFGAFRIPSSESVNI